MIVTEVVWNSTIVSWNRFGLETSKEDDDLDFHWIGSEVEWLDESERYSFEVDEYRNAMSAFEALRKNP